MLVTRYEDAVTLRVRTPDDIEAEMDEPMKACYSQFDYQFPNGVICGVGKSKRPGHASLFQIMVTDFNGKNAFKFEKEYSGEYTSVSRAEAHLRIYCKESWGAANSAKSTQVKRSEADATDQGN